VLGGEGGGGGPPKKIQLTQSLFPPRLSSCFPFPGGQGFGRGGGGAGWGTFGSHALFFLTWGWGLGGGGGFGGGGGWGGLVFGVFLVGEKTKQPVVFWGFGGGVLGGFGGLFSSWGGFFFFGVFWGLPNLSLAPNSFLFYRVCGLSPFSTLESLIDFLGRSPLPTLICALTKRPMCPRLHHSLYGQKISTKLSLLLSFSPNAPFQGTVH